MHAQSQSTNIKGGKIEDLHVSQINGTLYLTICMSLTTVNEDVEALRAELREKERDLLLAARYGKSLLEENDLLKEELENARQEHANITEVSELFGVCLVPS